MNIYQYADGTFLPDTSQPDPNNNFEITSSKFTPHTSTRYINIKIGNNGKAQREINPGDWVDVDKDLPELYGNRKDCCGCFACYCICPAKAITMLPDEEGFLYPVIDSGNCIRCYKCLSVCDFQKR